LQQGVTVDSFLHGRKIEVKIIPGSLPANNTSVSEVDEAGLDSKQQQSRLTVTSFYPIHYKNYSITSYNYVTRSDQILSGIEASIIWKWLFILSLIALSARLVSKIILAPFNSTLSIIQSFSLRQKEKITFPDTRTKEFQQLNGFLKKMTDKAVEDYSSLKAFTENASHELQTPVAVMRGKLDLLMESGLKDDQAIMIAEVQNTLDKLSRINNSLTLLTKLENHEYETKEPVHLSDSFQKAISSYKELMDMKFIQVTTGIEKNIYVSLHPLLTELLLSNLISNAIRHNNKEGQIEATLTPSDLTLKNTGAKPDVPTEELFKRFKKGNQCANSIGIGLAIVKQICDRNNFNVEYIFDGGWHILKVHFNAISPVLPVLPVAEKETIFQPAFG
jgi:two-component system, OmpR family, sensor histidine kinase QseC